MYESLVRILRVLLRLLQLGLCLCCPMQKYVFFSAKSHDSFDVELDLEECRSPLVTCLKLGQQGWSVSVPLIAFELDGNKLRLVEITGHGMEPAMEVLVELGAEVWADGLLRG